MSRLKNDKEQYEKYLAGKMSAEEAHAFERDVLSDPFEQEALEGFESSNPGALTDVEMLQGKVFERKSSAAGWMRVAAVVALLIVGSFTVWLLMKPLSPEKNLAEEIEKTEEPSVEQDQKEELAQSPIESTDSESPETETIAESRPEVLEIKPDQMPEEEIDQAFLEVEAEEVALADDETISFEEDDALELGDEALAMEVLEEEQLMAEMPIATEGAEFFKLDSPVSIELKQNLVVGDLDTETDEIAAQKLLQGAAAGVQVTRKKARGASSRSTASVSNSVSKTITGTVTDDAGESMPGVNVIIKGTTTGTTTDLDGNYQLTVDPSAVLVFAFVGFETQEVEVGARNTIDVTIGGVTELQEVVVTGYGFGDNPPASFTAAKPTVGNKAYKRYLEENLTYPQAAIENNIKGTVTLELTVSSSGAILSIDIKKSLGHGCDEEAIRLVNEGPKWSAAERNGSRVEDKVKVKVRFKR